MQQVFYIFDDEGEVIAIFKDEEFARDYLYHLGVDEEYCRVGMLADSVFSFAEHDAKYYTFKDSSLKMKTHKDCTRFKVANPDDEEGFCFLTDEEVNAYDECCTMVDVKYEK